MSGQGPIGNPDLDRVRDIWQELSGRPLPLRHRVQRTVLLAIATLRVFRVRKPITGTSVRREAGTECGWHEEIAAWYENMSLGPFPCIGQNAVLRIVNGAASSRCHEHVCPEVCPTRYIPQAQLGSYTCTATTERGYLLQRKEVWNCDCEVGELDEEDGGDGEP